MSKYYAIIQYFSTIGVDEDGTRDVRVLRWKCEDEEEFNYATEVIDEDDIFDIYFWED